MHAEPARPRHRAAAQRTRRILALLLWALVATGCAVVPGIRMDTGTDERFTPEGGDPDDFEVMVRPIDADLLLEQSHEKRERRQHRRQARSDLVKDYQYRVGAGDTLLVVVWGHPEITNPTGQTENLEQQGRVVRDDGTIFFPHIGTMHVEGLTVEEIRQRIAANLRNYVQNPQVDVRVAEFRSKKVYVSGEVNNPRTIALTNEPLTALDAINAVGGLADNADRRRLEIARDNDRIVLDALQLYSRGRGDQLLEDRDVLYVPDNRYNRVFVMGETESQTSVPLHDGRLSLAEAISEVGGIDLGIANTEQIYVVRGEPVYDRTSGELQGVRPDLYHLNARSGTALLLAEGFELQPRDIVYVSSSGIVRFNRVISQILPTVQALWQTDRILRD